MVSQKRQRIYSNKLQVKPALHEAVRNSLGAGPVLSTSHTLRSGPRALIDFGCVHWVVQARKDPVELGLQHLQL